MKKLILSVVATLLAAFLTLDTAYVPVSQAQEDVVDQSVPPQPNAPQEEQAPGQPTVNVPPVIDQTANPQPPNPQPAVAPNTPAPQPNAPTPATPATPTVQAGAKNINPIVPQVAAGTTPTPIQAPVSAQTMTPALLPSAPGQPNLAVPNNVPVPPFPNRNNRPPMPGTPGAASSASGGQHSANISGSGASFYFDDADVFEVIQTVFGDLLHVNYIIDANVKGRVNFRTTTPIPKDKILPIAEIILRLNGIAVVEESGLYRIIPMGNLAKEPAPIRFGKSPASVELKGTGILQLIPLSYINSSEMSAVLTPLLTQGGSILDVQKKNMLIIADTDSNVRRLLQIVEIFDVDSYKDATQPKVYVYPLQNSKADHVSQIVQQVILGGSSSSSSTVKTTTVSGTTPGQTTAGGAPRPGPVSSQGSSGSSTAGGSLVAQGTKVVADDVTNSLVIYASPGDYAIILNAIKQIDTVPRQVMIEAVVASVTLTDNMTYGMRWNMGINANDVKVKPFTRPITLGGPLGFQGLTGLAAGAFGYTATDPTGNVRLTIQADVTNGKAKILSAPHLLVADNREAKIQVGSEIPIATSTTVTPLASTSTTTTNTSTSTIQYKDVGTILKIKPQINDSGLILLEMSQEVSSYNTQNILGTDQFVITKNEVSTNLVAHDGETIVIGGLVSETTSLSTDGIPGVSKIPILGKLFGTTTDNKERQELLILITPHVVKSEKEASKLTNEYSEMFKNVTTEFKLGDNVKSKKAPSQTQPDTTGPIDQKDSQKAPNNSGQH